MPMGRSGPFASVRKDLGGEIELFVDFALDEESAIGEVVESGLGHDGFTRASIEEPFAGVFLQPDWKLVPDFSHAETFVGVAGGDLEHGEGADLGDVFRFLDDG